MSRSSLSSVAYREPSLGHSLSHNNSTKQKNQYLSPVLMYFVFSVAQHSKSTLGRRIGEVYRKYAVRDTHTREDASESVTSSSQRPLPSQNKTNTRDEHPCRQQDSNPRSQQSSGSRNTPRPRATGILCSFFMYRQPEWA
jgi:hypothetical protein